MNRGTTKTEDANRVGEFLYRKFLVGEKRLSLFGGMVFVADAFEDRNVTGEFGVGVMFGHTDAEHSQGKLEDEKRQKTRDHGQYLEPCRPAFF